MASKPKTPQKVSAILKVSDLLEKQIAAVEDRPDAQTRVEIIEAIRASGRMLSSVQASRLLNTLIRDGRVCVVRIARKNKLGATHPITAYCVNPDYKPK